MRENNFNNNIITHSAQMLSILEEQEKEFNKIKRSEEFNNPTNISLRTLIEQNIKLLNESLERNKLLEEQVKISKENEENAKREARHNRIWSYISALIALLSLIASIIIPFIKL